MQGCSSDTNLIVDGNFMNDLGVSWTGVPGATSPYYYNDDNKLYFGDYTPNEESIVYQTVATKPGMAYTLTFNVGPSLVDLQFGPASNNFNLYIVGGPGPFIFNTPTRSKQDITAPISFVVPFTADLSGVTTFAFGGQAADYFYLNNIR